MKNSFCCNFNFRNIALNIKLYKVLSAKRIVVLLLIINTLIRHFVLERTFYLALKPKEFRFEALYPHKLSRFISFSTRFNIVPTVRTWIHKLFKNKTTKAVLHRLSILFLKSLFNG